MKSVFISLSLFCISALSTVAKSIVNHNYNSFILDREYANEVVFSDKSWRLVHVSGEESSDDIIEQFYAMIISEKSNPALIFLYRESSHCQFGYRYIENQSIKVKTLNDFLIDGEKINIKYAGDLLSILSKGNELTININNIHSQQNFSLYGSSNTLKKASTSFLNYPMSLCNTWSWGAEKLIPLQHPRK